MIKDPAMEPALHHHKHTLGTPESYLKVSEGFL